MKEQFIVTIPLDKKKDIVINNSSSSNINVAEIVNNTFVGFNVLITIVD